MHNSPGGSGLAEPAAFHAFAMALSAALASTFAAPLDSEVDAAPPNENIVGTVLALAADVLAAAGPESQTKEQ